MEPAERTSGLSSVRALLPLICCIFVGTAFLAWQFHSFRAAAARIIFDVRLDGQRFSKYRATLNNVPYENGSPSGIGSRNFHIESPETEPFETNLFVWYSGASLGTINLQRSKGTLALDVAPTPNTVAILGESFQENFPNCERKNVEVPTGDYEIVSKFEGFTINRHVSVTRNNTTPVVIRPGLAP